jgi:lactate dehydrogenase-like 2-hydroxyacid dehydrogenase
MDRVIVVTESDLPGDGMRRLRRIGEVRCWTGAGRPYATQLHPLVAGAEAILCIAGDRVDAALLDAAGPGLRMVALASAGYDGVDLQAAAQRGITVTHTPGVLHESTADLAFALALMARRRLGMAGEMLRDGRWTAFQMNGMLGLDVFGCTMGIIGYGEIGRAVARRAQGFGMRILRYRGHTVHADDPALEVDLGTLLSQSDVISVHTPLTAATHHLIGAPEFALMKPTATLVNTARGPVVDTCALLQALREGRLHSAGLDVFENEPLGDNVQWLRDEGRLVALPHVGSATEATRAAMVNLAVDNIDDVLGGRTARTPVPPGKAADQHIPDAR